MTLSLYHYVHCPFCVRVRMALGHLGIPYKSIVVPYHDETTPVALTGVKMLPILKHDSGALNESLDIIQFLDKGNILKVKAVTSDKSFQAFQDYLNYLGNPVHSLAMPYWMWTPEFNAESRAYFKQKKEGKRGSFSQLVQRRSEFEATLNLEWPKLEKELMPFYQSDKFGLKDILLAAHLWGLYIVPEFKFPEKIDHYLRQVKLICNFNYHEDFWRET
jgi:glutaredoxin 2